jgi:hypothetical protein
LKRDVDELKKFAKTMFDVDTILTTANDLKYTRAIQNKLSEWMTNPSEDFVKLLASDLLLGKRFTPTVKDQFTIITKRAFDQLIGERINDRLKGAMTSEASPPQEQAPVIVPDGIDENLIVTTPEEIEGLHIVRAILRDVVNPRRIVMRDSQSYCAILLDDNNRKPVCRLRFNNLQKLSLGLFNEKKEEEKVALSHLDDLYKYADQLKATILLHAPKDVET